MINRMEMVDSAIKFVHFGGLIKDLRPPGASAPLK